MFKYFGTAEYSLQGSIVEIPDITKHIIIPSEYKNDERYFFYYDFQDTDTLARISEVVYKSQNYYWVLILMNDMVNVIDALPVPYYKFNEWFADEIGVEPTDIYHYVDAEGNVQDPTALVLLGLYNSTQEAINALKLDKITYYEYYYALNENKRKMKILLPEYLPGLIKQVEGLFNG